MPFHEALDPILREELSAYDDIIAGLLARRGITTREAAEKFLNPSYANHLHNPLLMLDMEKAAKRLAQGILSGEKIAVWSDYDCDGVPGAVLLHDFLKKAGANFENYIPHRHLEGYGVNVAGIESLAKKGVTLVVTVDSGITDVSAIARANELGMTVIVTDHHLPAEKLPEAFAILNPNAREEETYPFKGLCGTGVAWKLVCATLEVLRTSSPSTSLRAPELPLGWEKWLLDMVALATIADMVPLVDENRVLVRFGLTVLQKSPRIGLQKMCRGARVNQRTMSEDDVGFMIAPRVNAASRMGDAIDAFRLFTTTDESVADELAKKLEKANRTRKAEAGAITRAVHERLAQKELRSVIVLGDPEWRPALLGLVANTIADEHERPVFLWGREGDMTLKGSVRSGGNTHVLELMRATKSAFIEYGGHRAAGGFSIRESEVFSLEDTLVEAHASLAKTEEAEEILADAPIALSEVNETLLKNLERLAPFGMDNPKPQFLLREMRVRTISRFGKGNEHVKISFVHPDARNTVEGVAFFAKGSIGKAADTLVGGSAVHALAHLERDTFSRLPAQAGGNPIRLRLIDIRVVPSY
jgi:single-stranded-DNA-specific exonuclease